VPASTQAYRSRPKLFARPKTPPLPK
jgi:hypothetical protein